MRQLLAGICLVSLLYSCGASEKKEEQIVVKSVKEADSLEKAVTPLSQAERSRIHGLTEEFYNKTLVRTGFNGGILVAKNGNIIFEAYHGTYRLKQKDPLTEHTAFHLASVSKTFTAMATLKLVEAGKINLDSSVQFYLPQFPYQGVTIKMLLSHRSGLPNYVHFMDQMPWDKHKFLTNDSLLSVMARQKPPMASKPGTHFAYCNTNYAMLALIIEKASGQSYPAYIKEHIFVPFGMTDTYVFTVADTATAMPSYAYNGRMEPWMYLDGVYGDKNIYCTPRDLYKWDQALRTGKFLKKETLDMAYTPYSFEKAGIRNYGLGWRMFLYPSGKIIYHNGYWHGNNTVFYRMLDEGYTIIVLGNKYNTNIYHVKSLAEELSHRSFENDNSLE